MAELSDQPSKGSESAGGEGALLVVLLDVFFAFVVFAVRFLGPAFVEIASAAAFFETSSTFCMRRRLLVNAKGV